MPRNQQNNSNQKVKVNEEVRLFVKASFKKYKKDLSYTDDKKEAKKQYYNYLIDLLPEAIKFVVRFGHIRDDKVQDTKTEIYKKLTDPKFVSRLTKEVEKGRDDGLELLPILIKEIMISTKRTNDELLHQDPNAQIYDISDLIKLCRAVLKKKLKKLTKAGVDEKLAFDLLCIIPDKEVIKISRFYRVKAFYECLYEHAKIEPIPFEDIMKTMIHKDFWEVFITFALLERRERFSKLADRQKQLYLDISTWCFATLDSYSARDIERIVNVYVNARRRDDSAGKDGSRRYALNTVSEDEYKKVAKVVSSMIAQSPQLEKYLS